MPKFGAVSRKNLEGVDPRLVRLHQAVILFKDHSVTDGVRTIEEQRKNVARGVSQTMSSKHLPAAGGFAKATDSTPFPPPNWNNVQKCLDAIKRIDPKGDILRFYHYQGYVKGMADALNIPIRQGCDWDSDDEFLDSSFIDLPHNELKG